MDFTARMVSLLGAFRRERNGLVADTMHCDGARYGLNFGVSLPTVRMIARRERPDHAFACFLIGQQVRELQLAAFHLADPDRLTDPAEAERWRRALNNTELAEEAAFALLSRSKALPQLLPVWLSDAVAAPLPAYAAMLAAADYAAVPAGACDTARAQADCVCCPCEEGAVAEFIDVIERRLRQS